jgi:hypothetical protein
MTFTSIFWMKKGRRDPDNLVMKGVDTPWFFCGCFLVENCACYRGKCDGKGFPLHKSKIQPVSKRLVNIGLRFSRDRLLAQKETPPMR